MKLFLPILLSLLLISCNDNTTGDTSAKEITEKSPTVEETQTEETESNTPAKRKANEDTFNGMNYIEHIVNGFWETDEENRNYAHLAEEIDYQIDYIIKNCTMKGEDHDALHVILSGIMKGTKAIKNSASYEEADEAIKKIQDLVNEFKSDFEIEEVAS